MSSCLDETSLHFFLVTSWAFIEMVEKKGLDMYGLDYGGITRLGFLVYF